MEKPSKIPSNLKSSPRSTSRPRPESKASHIAGSLGITFQEDTPLKSETNRWFGSNKSSSNVDRKPSKSPTRHKIQVYDSTAKQQQKVSPYLCEVVKWPKDHPPLSQTYQEMYVSDREYKLLQSAFNLQPLPPNRPQVRRFQRTLFGYISLPPPPTEEIKEDEIKKLPVTPKKSTNLRGSSRETRGKSPRDQNRTPAQSSVGCQDNPIDSQTETDDNEAIPSDNSDDTDSDERPVSPASKKQPAKPKLKESSASPIILTPKQGQNTDHSLGQKETQTGKVETGEFGEIIEKFIQTIHPPAKTSSNDAQLKENFEENKNKLNTESIKSTIFAASETCMILMHTLFGDALEDPNATKILEASKEFKHFIKSTNEMQALETAAIIFDTASKAVNNYLNQIQDTLPSPPTPSTPKSPMDRQEEEEEEDEEDSFKDAKEETEGILSIEGKEIETLESFQTQIETGTGFLPPKTRAIGTKLGNGDYIRFQMNLTSTPGMGLLTQVITCANYEFKLNFVGTPQKINSLMSATRTKSWTLSPTPLQLLEMTERIASYTVGRLTAAKYHLLSCYDKSTITIRECLAGKHGYYSKTLKRANLKLRGLNTFSGIVLQMSSSLIDMFKRLFVALEVVMHLEDILQCPKVPGSHPPSKTHLSSASLASLRGGHNSLTQLTLFLNELENLMELGRTSLAGIQMKNPNVKIKKSLKEIVKILCEAVIQLDTKHHVDLGTLVMSMVCNVNLIISNRFSPVVTNLDMDMRRNLMGSLHKLNHSVLDVYELVKRMSILGSHLANKSLQKLKTNKAVRLLGEKGKNQGGNVPWYKRRIFHRRPERTYSLISVPSPDQRREEEIVVLRRRAESACQITSSVSQCPTND